MVVELIAMLNIYERLKAAGVPIDHHESDLYAKVTPESTAIVADYKWKTNTRTFVSQTDNALWYEIPFAYQPYWEQRYPISVSE